MKILQQLREKKRLPLFIILSLTTALCFTLLALRIHYTARITFLFLIWNTFLALIPYLISTAMILCHEKIKHRYLLSLPIAVWLCFFPNAPYILTDLFHLKERAGVPYWYDLALILSFAWNGLMLGYASLYDIQEIISVRFSILTGWILTFSFLILGGFGIYLGRYLRWNSWDVITEPSELMGDITDRIVNPLEYPNTYGVTIVFSVFLILGYLIMLQFGKRNQTSDFKS